ncbi:ATP-binding cassette domain-containing protein [Streptomyces sp. NPDC005955]|uniref:ABC transporter ATP-binding protein n=1 Tax=Streptomyces sp. NPDC005955 TaxID=3364738 RepID=UPI00369D3402
MTAKPAVSAVERDRSAAGLSARDVTLSYDGRPVVRGVSVDLPTDGLTAIIGPNGSGKSTLLKAFARVLKPASGTLTLGGTDIHSLRGKQFARQVALLPQNPQTPAGITVRALVQRGRHPHHTLLRQWTPDDDRHIEGALHHTGLTELADTPVSALSGGQRQRAWIAMILAQDTRHVLLDEPTTYLDVAHQYDLLELCAQLHRRGRAITAVLHDLNQAAHYATHLIVLQEGAVVAQGAPVETLTADLVAEVFGLTCDVIPHPQTGAPHLIPRPQRRTDD